MRDDYYSNDWVNIILTYYPLDENLRLSVEELNEALIEGNLKPSENSLWLDNDYYEYRTLSLEQVLVMSKDELNQEWRRISGLTDNDAEDAAQENEIKFFKAG